MVGRSRHLWTPEQEEMDGDDVVMKDGYGYDRGGFPQYANPYPNAPSQYASNSWGSIWPESGHIWQNKGQVSAEETARQLPPYEQSLTSQNRWRDLEQTQLKARIAKETLERQLREGELARRALEQQVQESEQRARAAKENMDQNSREREKIAQEHARFEAAQHAQQARQQQQVRQNISMFRNESHDERPVEYVKYSELVLPRVIRLNFQKSKFVEDIWQFTHLFVDDLDRLNPEYEFTQQQYEEIWAHCVRDCSRSGEFLLTLGFVNNHNDARLVIEDGARLIKETRALRNAIKKKNKYPDATRSQKKKYVGGSAQTEGYTFQAFQGAPQKQVKPIFNPPTGPRADRAPPNGNAPRTTVWNKEGTIVGHSAKEIGAENKGRAMLEKMGWSAGMSLGTENKGILAPVPVVVKLSTLGLGMDPQQARRDNTWAKTQR